MIYIDILTSIINRLKELKYSKHALDIQEAIDYSATSTELMLQAGDVLINIKTIDTQAYLHVEELIESYFTYCKSIGLFFNVK